MTQTTADATRERIGQVGVWLGALRTVDASEVRETAAELEELGYRSLWTGETPWGREVFTHAALMLAATSELVVGTGIASIWLRHPTMMHGAAQSLGDGYPGRFVLGMGVSHPHVVQRIGDAYERPFTRMRSYIDEMDAAAQAWMAPPAKQPVPRVLAALRPRMLELSRDRTDGAHPYFVPVAHTARAREALGAGPLLVPEQAVVLDSDPERARAVAREHTGFYLTAPNYTRNLRELGFTDDDLQGSGSDRLVDAIVACGDEDAIRRRVREHLDAGADHVLLQPLVADRAGLGMEQLRKLAPALTTMG